MEKAKCMECEKWLSSKIALKIHTKRCHSIVPRTRLQCELCPKTFYEEKCMKVHRVIFHHGQRPFVCQIDKVSVTTFKLSWQFVLEKHHQT